MSGPSDRNETGHLAPHHARRQGSIALVLALLGIPLALNLGVFAFFILALNEFDQAKGHAEDAVARQTEVEAAITVAATERSGLDAEAQTLARRVEELRVQTADLEARSEARRHAVEVESQAQAKTAALAQQAEQAQARSFS
jgi:hypothetical protein